MEYHVQYLHRIKSLEGRINIMFQIICRVSEVRHSKAEKHTANIFLPCAWLGTGQIGQFAMCQSCAVCFLVMHTANCLFCRVLDMLCVLQTSTWQSTDLPCVLRLPCVLSACRFLCRVLDNLQTTNDQAHDKCSFSGSDEMGSYILYANLTS